MTPLRKAVDCDDTDVEDVVLGLSDGSTREDPGCEGVCKGKVILVTYLHTALLDDNVTLVSLT
jgi:hypothetical protein